LILYLKSLTLDAYVFKYVISSCVDTFIYFSCDTFCFVLFLRQVPTMFPMLVANSCFSLLQEHTPAPDSGNNFYLKLILSNMLMDNTVFFWMPLCILFHPFAVGLCKPLKTKWICCRHHITGSHFSNSFSPSMYSD
jgi:hypothetical protein